MQQPLDQKSTNEIELPDDDHRIELWLAVCRQAVLIRRFRLKNLGLKDDGESVVWRSKVHSDGSSLDGWFVLGMYKSMGRQLTYHLPMDRWSDCEFAETLVKAPEWDGHSAMDVLERLRVL